MEAFNEDADRDDRIDIAKLADKDYNVNDVAAAMPRFNGNPSFLSLLVAEVMQGLNVDLPEPLIQLAKISAFKLFVTTTYDSMLEKAITQVRGQPPLVISVPDRVNAEVLIPADLRTTDTVVVHILGKVNVNGKFGLTETQVLERMHELMVSRASLKEGKVCSLLNRLATNHLLLLGVSFPDWLARFLIRAARNHATWERGDVTWLEFIADSGVMHPEFKKFLRTFCRESALIYEGGTPVQLVRELAEDWEKTHPLRAAVSGLDRSESENRPYSASPGSIFISYASEDRPIVEKLVAGLRNANCDVWFDQDSIEPDRKFDDRIRSGILNACAFVPVLSQNSIADHPRAMRREWFTAAEKAKDHFATSNGFIFSLVIDETRRRDITWVPEAFKELTPTPAPDGTPPPKWITRISEIQKQFRLNGRRK